MKRKVVLTSTFIAKTSADRVEMLGHSAHLLAVTLALYIDVIFKKKLKDSSSSWD